MAAARRRRRAKIRCSSQLFAFILFNLLLLTTCVGAHLQAVSSRAQQIEPHQQRAGHLHRARTYSARQHLHLHQHLDGSSLHSSQSAAQTGASGGLASAAKLCASLPSATVKHLKLCKLIGQSVGAQEAVSAGTARGLAECRNQFKSERWNCTHAYGDDHLLVGNLAQSVGNRESAFVQAIAAAGIVHAIASACSVGSLLDCSCEKKDLGLVRDESTTFKWGGCSNNIRHGTLYAKHLVELLDAVHQHQQARQLAALEEEHQLDQTQRQVRRTRRSAQQAARQLSAGNKLVEQLVELTTVAPLKSSLCARNLSQAAHAQIIKSLLGRNSLERHQEFRLAVNMHNNKVGRMAVARTMKRECRCHGLSGSCSLKTCWLKLDNFEVIGAYLKRKYESSVHLPTAINVNKLIPMMDRNEISAILIGGRADAAAAAVPQPQPQPQSAQQPQPPPPPPPQSHFNIYERHKQLEQLASAAPPQTAFGNKSSALAPADSLDLPAMAPPAADDELLAAAKLTPMTQQQYQALLREMKLCNSSGHLDAAAAATRHVLAARSAPAAKRPQAAHLAHQQQPHQLSGPSLKAASLHLSQLLQASNKEELVHLHRSPDYCSADLRHGFVGVAERVCSLNPADAHNCDRLCCGRERYRERTYTEQYHCECKFQYCCKIHCNFCERTKYEHVCV